MNARIDFDSLLDRQCARESGEEARERRLDVANPLVTADLMICFAKAFIGRKQGIAYPQRNAQGAATSVATISLAEAIEEASNHSTVYAAFDRMCTCAPADLVDARSAWQTAVAMSYITLYGDCLAAHRVDHPELYA